jgi:hypothetical protein
VTASQRRAVDGGLPRWCGKVTQRGKKKLQPSLLLYPEEREGVGSKPTHRRQ